jgi:methylase of polypeptide subunit release factors
MQDWATYRKMMSADFLEHRCLYGALQALLLSELGADAGNRQPLDVLEVGCGDAAQSAAALRAVGAPSGGLRLGSYMAVDMSAPALALADGNLDFLQPACQVTLVQVR